MTINAYALICYAIHDKTVISVDTFTDISKAYMQLTNESRQMHDSIRNESDADERTKYENINLDIDSISHKATLKAFDKEWTWQIVDL